jgi:hypothetical protein
MSSLRARDHLEKTWQRWENNIKMNVEEMLCKDADSIHTAEDVQSPMVTISTAFFNVQ